jgi:DNA-binding GntR family transcriptional regulator
VAKVLRDEIVDGTLTGHVPSAEEIAQHHQVSDRVAAPTLELLQGEGLLRHVPGEGHIVRHPAGITTPQRRPGRPGQG